MLAKESVDLIVRGSGLDATIRMDWPVRQGPAHANVSRDDL